VCRRSDFHHTVGKCRQVEPLRAALLAISLTLSIVSPFFGQNCTECYRRGGCCKSHLLVTLDVREAPMNSTPSPKTIDPDEALVARADERLAHAYAQIARADEQIARVNEQIAKLDHGAARDPSAAGSRRPARGRSLLRGLIGLLLAACIFLAAFVSQSSYGDATRVVIAEWVPQRLLASSPVEASGLAAQPGPSAVRLAAAEPIAPPSIPAAPAASQDGALATAPASPEPAQLLETMTRDLANLEQRIEQLKVGQEQLKAAQEQAARENARAIEELKAGQEKMTLLMAKASEQVMKASEQTAPAPKTSRPNLRAGPSVPPPPGPVAAAARKPAPTLPSPQARAQPRAPTQLQPGVQ
jgi:hypothetical protein